MGILYRTRSKQVDDMETTEKYRGEKGDGAGHMKGHSCKKVLFQLYFASWRHAQPFSERVKRK